MPHSIPHSFVMGSLSENGAEVRGSLLVRGHQGNILTHDSQGPVHVQVDHPGMHSKIILKTNK